MTLVLRVALRVLCDLIGEQHIAGDHDERCHRNSETNHIESGFEHQTHRIATAAVGAR